MISLAQSSLKNPDLLFEDYNEENRRVARDRRNRLRGDQQDSSNQRSTHSWPRGAHLLPRGAHARPRSRPRVSRAARSILRFPPARSRDRASSAGGANVSGSRAIIAMMTVRLSRASLAPRSIMAAKVAASLSRSSSHRHVTARRGYVTLQIRHPHACTHAATRARARACNDDRRARRFFLAGSIVRR